MVNITPQTVFSDLLERSAKSGIIDRKTKEASVWFREQAKKTSIKPEQLIRQDKDRLSVNAKNGHMYFFFYDPKHKATLPYYDRFPLIFRLKNYDDGILGLNLHYLPYNLRAKLMDALHSLASDKKYDENTKLLISYEILNSAAKFKYFKPTIKRYLFKHMRSKYMEVYSNEWDMALMLPVEAFTVSRNKVWQDSRNMMR